jgi:spore coat polysaccharide biosynthesis protein SpsF
MKTVAIIQARTASTRLPGKSLKTVLGKSLLAYQIERVRRAKRLDMIGVALPDNPLDDVLIEACEDLEIPVVRGSEADVLSRYQKAAVHFEADVVVRLTADCPVIDPATIDRVIERFQEARPPVDYASNVLTRTYPRGMDTEVFSAEALKQAASEAKEASQREHVTPFFYQQPQRYRLEGVTYSNDESRHRWTVDTAEDFELIKRIIESLYPNNPAFTLEDMLVLLAAHPKWSQLNANVPQKPLLSR